MSDPSNCVSEQCGVSQIFSERVSRVGRAEEAREVEEGWMREGRRDEDEGGVLPCSKVKLVMSAVTHSSQHALLTSGTSSSLLSVALSSFSFFFCGHFVSFLYLNCHVSTSY